MLYRSLFCLLITQALLAQPGGNPPKGRFIGTLVLLPQPDGRNMQLQQPFSYVDWEDHELDAPAGFISDGASIPRAAWTLVGGPWDGKYRTAAVVHDVGCVTHKYTSGITHRLFYEAMLDSGVEKSLALTMYYAVILGGPSWQKVANVQAKDQGTLQKKIEEETHRKPPEKPTLHYRDPDDLATGVHFEVDEKQSGIAPNQAYQAVIIAEPLDLDVQALPTLAVNELRSKQQEILNEEAKGHITTPEEIEAQAFKVVAASPSRPAKNGFTQVVR